MLVPRQAMLRKLHLRDEYYRRRARQSFAEFLRYTKPDYQLSWFHEELAAALDGFLDDVLARRSPRLIFNVPPQEGKSEQMSRRFPAYALGLDPNLRVVACSYSATLALQFSRDVQLIMDEPNYARLLPESAIPGIA